MKQNILLLFAMVLFCTANAYAQLGKDCISAATICGTSQIPAPTAGRGDITDAVPNDCGVSEHNSTWVTFVVTTAGSLTMNFDANPNNDIDFALWRIPGGGTIAASCAALTEEGTNDRCDYNSSSTESGFGTTCGTGAGCDTEGNLTVSVGDRIIAMVDDFGSFNGFAFTPTVGGTSQRACNTVKCNSCASPTCTGSSVYANYAAASGDPSAGCNTDEIRIPGSQIQDFCMTFTTPATLTTNEIAFDGGVNRTPGTCGLAFTSETLYSNACGAITSSGTDAASGFPKFPVAPSTTYKYCMTWTGTSCTQIQSPCFRPFYSPAPACVTPTPGINNNESPVSTVITCANPGISVTATGGATYAWSGGSTPTTAANTFTSAGTYTVTVTAATGGATCTATASITITGDTTPTTTPTFAAIPAFCSGTTAPTLPTSSTNTPAITGTWSPSTVSNTASGTYIFTPDAGQCATTATLTTTVTPNTTPTFAAIPAFCSGTTAPTLPTSSTNTPAITGTWSPSTVSNTASGTYTFTPDAGQCATTATLTTTVTPNTTPTFAAIPAFCSGTTAPTLPASSTNTPAITGTWSPSTVSNTASGTYTFTPDAGQCATTATLTTTVTPNTTPTFAAIPAFCSGTTAPTLPASSTNTPAITGTWSPSTVSNTASGTYTFTPDAGQCATTATLTTTVTPNTTPTFAAIPAFCSGTTAPTLPTSSTNTPAITGTWSPSTVSNTASGTYTFTPDAGQCATTATLTTTVTPNTTPTFAAIPAFCSGTTAPTLPASSTNTPAITGTWSPATIDNTTGATYTFTPDAGQCATTATLTTTVNNCTVPTATVSADITDPCFCVTVPILNASNVVTTLGILGDVMTIATNPPNTAVVWNLVAGANTTITSGATAVHIGGGVYTVDVTYTDNGAGWAVTATPAAPDAGLGVQNGAGGTSCTYTIGSFPNLTATACTALNITGATPAGGTYSPTSIAAPAPGSAATTVALQYTYNSSVNAAGAPACPLILNATATIPACPVGCAASPNMIWND
jgi:hypothetical protein